MVHASFDPIRLPRLKKADLIAQEVRTWIVNRQLAPGDRLPNEKDLITIFASSRGTVREALKVLEAQGLIEISQGIKGGARVSEISFESASTHLKSFFYFQNLSWSEVYEFRAQIEPPNTELAVPRLPDQAIRDLEKTVVQCQLGHTMRIPVAEHRLQETRFHQIIATHSPNPIMRFATLYVLDLLMDLTRHHNIISSEPDEFSRECVDAHSEILALIAARDASAARDRMRTHIQALGRYVGDREHNVERHLLLGRHG